MNKLILYFIAFCLNFFILDQEKVLLVCLEVQSCLTLCRR